jgi:di/tricarboxylate transporter
MSTVDKITDAILSEIKAILRESVHDAEAAIKKRLRKILIMGVVIGVLTTLVISFLGSAALFILIGSLEYLSTIMPRWEAWDIMGLTSGVIGGLLFLLLFIIIRKQLRSNYPA